MESSETSLHHQPSDSNVSGLGTSRGGDEVSGLPDGMPGRKPISTPLWLRVVPFFLSAFFFLSALFSIFAPLPILFLRFRAGRKWSFIAILTNSLIVGVAAGTVSLAFYFIFVVAVAVSMSEGIDRRKSLEKIAAMSLVTAGVCGVVVLAWYSFGHSVNWMQEVRLQISAMVDFLQQSMSNGSSLSPGDIDEWKKNLFREFPSAVAVFALVLVWANLVTLLRINPAGIRDKMGLNARFLREWKAPEWLVWPTIVTAFFLIVEVGRISYISLNLFRFFMAIYAIQGLSVLSFFFDLWKVRGFFRTVGFLIATFLMMPLLLSLGFFDLWFDFRSKFRQSS
ncbi:DUF2232 domain-containing protein [Bdellovibrionota bacterium FG-1]